ncbi:ATP-dependent DNA helicase RecQ [Ornithinibacillus sp. 4-3]|uniref:ATP-dependent DNA helicase RecQ n=1 Tax=Ornithinibacillus sp. 4-3 TaxID=3231488 RepID=A0AB39HKS5_9BACI
MHNRKLDTYIEQFYGYTSFRPGQKEIMESILQRQDVLGVLPTGSGKSLCYELPARLLSGTTIVVSPLIALMIDQVKQLKANGMKRVVALNSFMDYAERQDVYRYLGEYKIIYISPELIQADQVLNRLKKIDISLFVIDEAHCISLWGHEFRPDYLKLSHVIKELGDPTVLALSATAPSNIQKDIIAALNRPNMKKHIYPIDKENICFSIQQVAHELEKIDFLTDFLQKHHVPTLIYFSSRNVCEQVAEQLSIQLTNRKVAFYHGGMEQMDRLTIQQQFMEDQIDIICCTNAFGMGINKPNIRAVIHFHLPSQIESFIQEIGRAGRDGEPSLSILLYAEHDQLLPRRIITNELPTKEQITVVFQQLKQLALQKQLLPKQVKEIEKMLGIEEIHWRFINYHLEKNDIIKNNQIIYQATHWQNVFEHIVDMRINRLNIKQNQLFAMLDWVHETDCLRESLYKGYQDTYDKPEQHCCSNCDFVLEQWEPPQALREIRTSHQDWQRKLKALLLIGENDETE